MREIKKKREPRSLAKYRSEGGIYDGNNFTPIKEEIRASLLKEQGYLCAYCMVRITSKTMKVEHWASQTDNDTLQLDYSNLLGCCMGYEGERLVNQTCDSRKGSRVLKFNPSRPQDKINTIIKYDGQGNIHSVDEEFSLQINSVLNLNKSRLVENRSGILNLLRSKLSYKDGSRTKAEIKRLLGSYVNPNSEGKLVEYCGLIEYYLNSRLRSVQ